MTSEDPRRKLIAEAMEAHDGEEWEADQESEYSIWVRCHTMVPGEVNTPICHLGANHLPKAQHRNARSIALSHNALPVAVELIEELTAELSRESYTLRRAVERAQNAEATIVARAEAAEKSLATCRDYIEKAEATIATQAKEIERLKEDVDRHKAITVALMRPDND